MEENRQFNYQGPSITGQEYLDAEDNILNRWLNPQIAEQKEFEKENYFMDKGNAFNEYMFDKANEYNSASAQMERAKEAGINPMLAAAGIAGSGGTATPMQSQGASVGMNTNANSPFDMINSGSNTIDTLVGTTDKLGKLIGFGKENKLNFEIAKKTASKLAEETGKTRWEKMQLQRTFHAFCRTAEANASAAEQNVKNLEKLFDKYQAEIDLLGKQKELTEEQIRTQEHVTKQEMYKEYEMQFKDAFRKMFGVQLNDSDLSMLTQLVLGGHGKEVINALSDMIKSIGEGIRGEIEENIPKPTKILKNVILDIKDIINDKKVENKHKRIENAIKDNWANNQAAQKQYGSYIEFRNAVIKEIKGGYSGKW